MITLHYIERIILVHIFILIFLFIETDLFAQGTAGLVNPLFGASALAQGNAFVARADDATAINFNPAGLTQLKDAQFSLGASFVLPFVDYRGQGIHQHLHTKINTLPDIYFAAPIVKDRLAAGLGVTVPFGLQGKWNENGFSRFVITDFDLRVIDINPSLAFKPFSFLSIGAGLNYYLTKTDQKRHINVGLINSMLTGKPVVPGTPEGFQDLETDGNALGYNVGLLFNITPRHSVGISFRSKADVDLDGKLKISNLSGATENVFGSVDFVSRASTRATIPEMLSFGYAYRHGDLWSVEADVQWTNWSRFDVLRYSFKPTNPLLEANKEDVRNWHNTLSFALGGEYKLNEALKLRGGYTFHETPVPESTFEPSVPQSNRHGLFVGFGYYLRKKSLAGEEKPPERSNKWIDFAYGTIFYEGRNVNNTVGDAQGGPIDGRYDLITYIMAINFNYSF
ncbi:MAG TPA: OmpP1/FadL family transporter [Candidatus Hypogeohydataceae bacterium YC41]